MMQENKPGTSPSTLNHNGVNPQSVCVVGSGPVGLAFALRLANAGKAVTLIDSGSFGAESEENRELTLGQVVSAASAADQTDGMLVEGGTLYPARDYLAKSRYISSGGNSWLWGVQWRPMAEPRVRIVPGAPADFEARPEFDIPAWSAPAAEVYHRYPDALEFFDLEGHDFEGEHYQDSLTPFSLPASTFPTKLFHFARASVIRKQRIEDAIAHPGIDVRSNLHLVGIETDRQQRVTALRVCSKDGTETRISAEHYVLAMGGIENSRHLLLAKESGMLADPHDVFGRWFFDHPHTRLGYLTGADQEALAQAAAWYDFQEVQGTPIMRGHEIDPETARQLGLLRFAVDLVGRPTGDASRTGVAMAAAWDAAKQRDVPSLVAAMPGLMSSPVASFKLARQALKIPIHNTGKGGWSDPTARYHQVESLSVEAMVEQRPSPDNRVRLGTKRDRLGLPLPVLQWSWSRPEVDSINKSADLVADAFRKAGIGSFVTMRQLGQSEVPRAGSGFHHMGGTRQSDDPADGVVNAENRVHGVENLTLIGSSIFPNSVGYANPTLTAVADAIRVADLLAK
jgi:choline dehydrogenase-like flavoprotein